jgi:hypothetical protein
MENFDLFGITEQGISLLFVYSRISPKLQVFWQMHVVDLWIHTHTNAQSAWFSVYLRKRRKEESHDTILQTKSDYGVNPCLLSKDKQYENPLEFVSSFFCLADIVVIYTYVRVELMNPMKMITIKKCDSTLEWTQIL